MFLLLGVDGDDEGGNLPSSILYRDDITQSEPNDTSESIPPDFNLLSDEPMAMCFSTPALSPFPPPARDITAASSRRGARTRRGRGVLVGQGSFIRSRCLRTRGSSASTQSINRSVAFQSKILPSTASGSDSPPPGPSNCNETQPAYGNDHGDNFSLLPPDDDKKQV